MCLGGTWRIIRWGWDSIVWRMANVLKFNKWSNMIVCRHTNLPEKTYDLVVHVWPMSIIQKSIFIYSFKIGLNGVIVWNGVPLWHLVDFQRLASPYNPIYVYVCFVAYLELSLTLVYTTNIRRLWECLKGIQIKITWWRVCLVCILRHLVSILIKQGLKTSYSWCFSHLDGIAED